MKIRKGEEEDQMRWGALTAGKKKAVGRDQRTNQYAGSNYQH